MRRAPSSAQESADAGWGNARETITSLTCRLSSANRALYASFPSRKSNHSASSAKAASITPDIRVNPGQTSFQFGSNPPLKYE